MVKYITFGYIPNEKFYGQTNECFRKLNKVELARDNDSFYTLLKGAKPYIGELVIEDSHDVGDFTTPKKLINLTSGYYLIVCDNLKLLKEELLTKYIPHKKKYASNEKVIKTLNLMEKDIITASENSIEIL